MDEMKRIIDQTVITEAITTWEYYVPRIIKQAQMEKGVHIEKQIQEIGINDDDCKIHILHSSTYNTIYTYVHYREQSCDSNGPITIFDP